MQNESLETRKAFGRKLSDLWLDGEEGKLHPAEWKLLECARLGEWCVLGDERPYAGSGNNRIRAELLRFLALGGDDAHGLHEQGVKLQGAYIECSNGKLDFEGCQLPRNVYLFDCHLEGELLFRDARAQTLSLRGTLVKAIKGERAFLDGSVFLTSGFFSAGKVRLLGAAIKGDLSCRDGTFSFADTALDCAGAHLFGALYLDDGFLALGQIDLTAISVGTHLHAMYGTFSKKGISLNAPRATIGGNVNFGEECRVAGQLSFQGAKIGGDVTFAGGSFEGQPCINLRNTAIDGMLVWRNIQHARGELNLAGASCRTLNMDFDSWERPAQVRLDNFTYRGFSELPKGCNSSFWVQWLERQPDNHLNEKFRPKPYSQLADVLETMGHEGEAVSIRVERRRRQAAFTRNYEMQTNGENGNKRSSLVPQSKSQFFHLLTIIWNFVQGALVDYGYRPGKAVLYLLGIIILGAGIYQVAAWKGIMTPTHPLIFKEAGQSIPERCARNWVYPGTLAKNDSEAQRLERECAALVPSEYSTFNALIYSADVALPIVNFRMEADWSPRVVEWKTGIPDRLGWWVRTWEWVQIALGWLLSLLFASAIGGIIRR